MGARQTGKSTLLRHAATLRDHLYLTLDSLDIRHQALADPEGLVGRAPRAILDEVQRAPDLLIAVKAAVDREPRKLWPLTRRERLREEHAPSRGQLLHALHGPDQARVHRAPETAPDVVPSRLMSVETLD